MHGFARNTWGRQAAPHAYRIETYTTAPGDYVVALEGELDLAARPARPPRARPPARARRAPQPTARGGRPVRRHVRRRGDARPAHGGPGTAPRHARGAPYRLQRPAYAQGPQPHRSRPRPRDLRDD